MRVVLIVFGVLLLAAGAWIVSGHASYQATDTLVQIGTAKLTATHDKPVPAWAGVAALIVGAVVALGGLSRKR